MLSISRVGRLVGACRHSDLSRVSFLVRSVANCRFAGASGDEATIPPRKSDSGETAKLAVRYCVELALPHIDSDLQLAEVVAARAGIRVVSRLRSPDGDFQ